MRDTSFTQEACSANDIKGQLVFYGKNTALRDVEDIELLTLNDKYESSKMLKGQGGALGGQDYMVIRVRVIIGECWETAFLVTGKLVSFLADSLQRKADSSFQTTCEDR